MILDIVDGTTEPDLFSITDFVKSCNVPLTYGGGLPLLVQSTWSEPVPIKY